MDKVNKISERQAQVNTSQLCDETMAAIHCVEGLIKYLGGHGNFIVDTPFGLILDAIIRNGGSVIFNITKQKHSNPVTFQKPLED